MLDEWHSYCTYTIIVITARHWGLSYTGVHGVSSRCVVGCVASPAFPSKPRISEFPSLGSVLRHCYSTRRIRQASIWNQRLTADRPASLLLLILLYYYPGTVLTVLLIGLLRCKKQWYHLEALTWLIQSNTLRNRGNRFIYFRHHKGLRK